jgi:macrolide phosphotransferase
MARTPLTLAALATSAVPGLEPAGAARLGTGVGPFDSAVLADADGAAWVIRIPRTEAAEAEQSAELVALRALTGGVRERLPFLATEFAGQSPVDETRAVVCPYVHGTRTPVRSVSVPLAESLGAAIAAIHALPTGFVTETGLPTLNAVHAQQTAATVIDQSRQTGLLPAALDDRWRRALDDDRLWQFAPTVIHGGLSAETVLHEGDEVVGVLGWQHLRVADPALDLGWLLGGRRSEVADAVFAGYTRGRDGADRQLRARATLYAELDVARWLLHGMGERSTEIVDDAVQMLHGLVDDVQGDLMNPLGPVTGPVLAVDDVEALLDRVERERTAS